VGIKLGSHVAELGRLETYTSIAERLGLKAESDHLRVEAARSTPEEADALELPVNGEVTRVSRLLRFDGETAAWMIDVIPADLMPAGKLTERLTPTRWCSTCSSTRESRSRSARSRSAPRCWTPASRPAGPWG
jgi:DNA-binding GntR family transcriptional regulator